MFLSLRPADANDARQLWEWANDPVTRKNAFDSNPIEWQAHVEWFTQKLADPDCRIWILENHGTSSGQIRYDRRHDCAEIDFAVDPNSRGQGLGTVLLELSAPKAFDALQVQKLIGSVKLENQPSIRAFERAGFQRAATVARDGELTVRFERTHQ